MIRQAGDAKTRPRQVHRQRLAKIDKSSHAAPGLEISKIIKRSNKKMKGFRGVDRIAKSGPGGTMR